jgi:hypothetical protein
MDHTTDRALRELRSYGHALTNAAELLPIPAPPAVGRRSPTPLRQLVTVTAAAAITFGVIGLGAVADAAGPGDPLYSLDRGIETVAAWVGLGADRTAERIADAYHLLATERPAEAIETAAAALEISDDVVTEAVLEAISTLPADATVRRLDLHIAIRDLITAAYDSRNDETADAIVEAAERIAVVARGAGGGSPEPLPSDAGDSPGQSLRSPGALDGSAAKGLLSARGAHV